MDDLIRRKDAERALTMLGAQLSEKHTRTVAKCICTIKDITAVDAEPVRHGWWIHATTEDDDWGGTFHRYTCSACNWSMGDNPTGWGIFCPHCGARMDGEEDNRDVDN